MAKKKPTKDNLDKIELAKKLALDPFEPLFPPPGMWHAVVSLVTIIAALICSTMTLYLHSGLIDTHPISIVVIGWGTPLLVVVPFIFFSRGHTWAHKFLWFLTFEPYAVILLDPFLTGTVHTTSLIGIIAAILSQLLLKSTAYNALAVILINRRQKIIELKKDGTYKQKLEEARKRWNIK